MQCQIDHKTDEIKQLHENNQKQMEKLRNNVSDLLKAFDDSKQAEMQALVANHDKELQLIRDSKANEVLRLNKAQTQLVKTQNSQNMRLKMEFGMKEMLYKNKINKIQEAHEKKLLELTDMHEQETKSLNLKIDQMNHDHAIKIKELGGDANQKLEEKQEVTKEMLHKHDAEKFQPLEEQEVLRKHKDCQISKMIKNMEEERHNTHHQITDLKETILTRDHTINERNSQILALEELLGKKEDVESQMAEALEREDENKKGREALQKEIEKQRQFVLELEEKVYRSNKTSLELLKQLKEAEIEIAHLQGYVGDL